MADAAELALRHAIIAERELLKARAILANHPLYERAHDAAAEVTALVGELNRVPPQEGSR